MQNLSVGQDTLTTVTGFAGATALGAFHVPDWYNTTFPPISTATQNFADAHEIA